MHSLDTSSMRPPCEVTLRESSDQSGPPLVVSAAKFRDLYANEIARGELARLATRVYSALVPSPTSARECSARAFPQQHLRGIY